MLHLQHAILQQIRHPLSILQARISSGNILHVPRIDEHDRHMRDLASVVDGVRISTRALHSSHLAFCLQEPSHQRTNLLARRATRANFIRIATFETSNDGPFVHIDPTTTLVHDLHEDSPPFRTTRAPCLWLILPYILLS